MIYFLAHCFASFFIALRAEIRLTLAKDQAHSKTSIDNGRDETNALNERAVLPRSLQEFRSPDERVHELTNTRFSRHRDSGGS